MTNSLEHARIIAARRRASAATNSFISFTSETGTPAVAVKDLIDVAGMPTTAGAAFDGAAVAARDATVVARVRASGAAIVGKTNLYEWAYGVSSANRTYGDVHNPWDYARSAGGSSSGSAAAVAAGLCDWAIGTDTAGSVRLPASLCGVVGYKPTHGLLPTDGVVPLSPSQDVVGVLAPDVMTAAGAAQVLAGQVQLPALSPVEDRGEVQLVVPAGWVADLDVQTEDRWRAFSGGLPERTFVPRQDLFDNAVTLQAFEAHEIHAAELRNNPHRFHKDVQDRIRNGSGVSPDVARAARSRLSDLAGQIDLLLAPGEVLVLPTTACVAPRLDEPDPREPLTRFTRPFSGSGHPAISIPLRGVSLPVGIQLVVRRNDDAWLFAAAASVELQIAGGPT